MNQTLLNDFYESVDQKVAILDGFIVEGTDQELFIASYLHGHIDVAVAKVEETDCDTLTQALNHLESKLDQQLQKAFENNELEFADQKQVLALLRRLFSL